MRGLRKIGSVIPSDRLLDRARETAEELRAGFGHMPAILQTDSERAGNVETGLVGETHASLKRCRIAMHQIAGLMAIHADAMSGAVRQARQVVSGPPPFAYIEAADRI